MVFGIHFLCVHRTQLCVDCIGAACATRDAMEAADCAVVLVVFLVVVTLLSKPSVATLWATALKLPRQLDKVPSVVVLELVGNS